MLAKSQQNKENDTLKECPICYKQTTNESIDYHTYNRYHFIWTYKLFSLVARFPLVKCIKCNFYTCGQCLYDQRITSCPQNCHELNQSKTIFNIEDVYKRYAANKAYNYEISDCLYPLYLAQSIYDQQENPQPELIKPCSKEQVLEALAITISLFDQVLIDIETQQISASIKLPFQDELIHISYRLELIVQIEMLYKVRDPQMIYNLMKSTFQDDIQKFFQDMIIPFGKLLNRAPYFDLDLIRKENRPNMQLSLAQMGHTEVIIKTLQKYIKGQDMSCCEPIIFEDFQIYEEQNYTYEYIQDQDIYLQADLILNQPITTKYILQSTMITISDYKKIIEPQIMNGTREERGVYNSRFATPQEFKNYFKDCK